MSSDLLGVALLFGFFVLPIAGILYLRPRYRRKAKPTMTPVEPVEAWLAISFIVVSLIFWFVGTLYGVAALGLALLIGLWVVRRTARGPSNGASV